MRPDEHRKKKNAAYKKRKNIQAPAKGPIAQENTDDGWDSNVYRYDENIASSETNRGGDYAELLQSARLGAVIGSSDVMYGRDQSDDTMDERGQSNDSNLLISGAIIRKVLETQTLDDILGDEFKSLRAMMPADDLANCKAAMDDYLEHVLDPYYIVDHFRQQELSDADILYRNTGRMDSDRIGSRNSNAAVSDPSCSTQGDIIKAVKDETEIVEEEGRNTKSPDSREEGERDETRQDEETGETMEDLEEWLDSVLD